MKKWIPALALLAFASCNGSTEPDTDPTLIPKATPLINYTIVAEHPHDTGAYTQGLQWFNGKLYEGTGDYEASSLRITDLKTGKVEKIHRMGTDKVFGEGITILKGKLYQLTWENHEAYVYDLSNITKVVKTFNWPYEGWGITNNGTDLIISDGSSNLYFVNPDDFKVKSILQVKEDAGKISRLNELEYIDGFVYANVYESDIIVKIDPSSGNLVGKMNLPDLDQQFFKNQVVKGRTDVLNGIAYDSSTKRMFITGKRWPKLFEVTLN